ncbi:MAG: phosphatidate cytidylyltransferase [Clostridia bacterium]|nr:phosphatidate cytidylyltransferase [Clostridia bacterium]
MLTRVISGAVFTAIMVAFFLLREFVDYRIFALLICFFCAVGTFEVVRAYKNRTCKIERVLNLIFGVLAVPFYAVSKYVFEYRFSLPLTITFSVAFVVLTILLVLIFSKKKDVNLLGFFYPSILLFFILECNSFMVEKGFIALLLIFVLSPLTDTFAYFVGFIYNKIRKGKAKKLCPNLSPKKTIAGAIGGLIGGVVGGILVYFIFTNKVATLKLKNGLVFFIIICVLGSIISQLGDLFESFVKRSVGIKDMGKIMPGHGGVMDRIDGITFAGAFIYAVFAFI